MNPSVFISYARADGLASAARLFRELADKQIGAWMDELSVDPYQDFTVEIERNIKSASHVVVCLTPSLDEPHQPKSWVRREILYALNQRKPIIPLLLQGFPRSAVPIQITDLTSVDFGDFDIGLAKLFERLRTRTGPASIRPPLPVQFRAHVESLLTFVVDKLSQTVLELREVLQLQGIEVPRAVKQRYESRRIAWFRGDEGESAPRHFDSVADALVEFQGRLLLLGEPGSGKTTISWVLLREKCYERMADPATALPVYAEIASWDGKADLVDWLASEVELDPRQLSREIEDGRALLVLDGLDELPDAGVDPASPDGPRRDYRIAFLDLLSQCPRTPIVVTCRAKDYDEIVAKRGRKANLNGAMTLLPLTDGQIETFLHSLPGLWSLLQADDTLREIARTPLVLTLLAIGEQRAAAEPTTPSASGSGFVELRDEVFKNYVEQRYRFERHRSLVPFPTIEKLYDGLGRASVYLLNHHKRIRFIRKDSNRSLYTTSGGWHPATAHILPLRALRRLLGPGGGVVIDAALALRLLIPAGPGALRFMHALIRDHFAVRFVFANLDNRQAVMRARAVGTMAFLGHLGATAALTKALSDQDESVRAIATWTLGELRTESAVEAIGKALARGDDNDIVFRLIAVDALGNIASASSARLVVTTLLKHYKNEGLLREEVSRRASEALTKIGEPAILPALEMLSSRRWDLQLVAAKVLHDLPDTRAVEPLIGALRYRGSRMDRLLRRLRIEPYDDQSRRAAAMALGRVNDPKALRPLIDALNDPAIGVRVASCEALGSLKIALAVQPLLEALRHRNAALRAAAATALGKIGDSGATPALSAALEDSNGEVRSRSARALGAIGDENALRPLTLLLSDPLAGVTSESASDRLSDEFYPDPYEFPERGVGDADAIGSAAALALGMIGRPDANRLLTTALASESGPRTRTSAAWALGCIEDARAAFLVRKEIATFPPTVGQPLMDLVTPRADPDVVEALLAVLEDPDSDVRSVAAWALGKSMHARAVAPLVERLRDPDAGVRGYAARALAQLQDAHARAPLELALADASAEVRVFAAEALGHIGNACTAEPLRIASRDAIAGVRRASIEALAELDGAAAAEVAEVTLGDPDPDVRLSAAMALGQSGDVRAIQPLVHVLSGGDEKTRERAAAALACVSAAAASPFLTALLDDRNEAIREIAARALGKRESEAIDRWLEALTQNQVPRLLTAIAALGDLGDARAVEPILGLLSHDEAAVRNGAVAALGVLGDRRAVEPVYGALHDVDVAVQESAALALGRLGDRRAIDPLGIYLRRFHDEMRSVFREAADPQRPD
jgi:HEAT repeat protein